MIQRFTKQQVGPKRTKRSKNSRIGIGIAAVALVWGLFSFQSANAVIIVTDLSSPVVAPGISRFTTDVAGRGRPRPGDLFERCQHRRDTAGGRYLSHADC